MRLGRPASNTAGNCHQMQCDCVSDRQSTRRSVPARRDLRLHCVVSTRAAAWPRRLCSACLVVSPVRPRNLLSMPSCSIMPWPHQTLMYEIIGDWPKPEARATCLQACWWLSKRLLNPTASLTVVVVVVCVRVCVCVCDECVACEKSSRHNYGDTLRCNRPAAHRFRKSKLFTRNGTRTQPLSESHDITVTSQPMATW